MWRGQRKRYRVYSRSADQPHVHAVTNAKSKSDFLILLNDSACPGFIPSRRARLRD